MDSRTACHVSSSCGLYGTNSTDSLYTLFMDLGTDSLWLQTWTFLPHIPTTCLVCLSSNYGRTHGLYRLNVWTDMAQAVLRLLTPWTGRTYGTIYHICQNVDFNILLDSPSNISTAFTVWTVLLTRWDGRSRTILNMDAFSLSREQAGLFPGQGLCTWMPIY